MRLFLKRLAIGGGGVVSLLLIFWLALAISYTIPSSLISGHAEESRAILLEESLYSHQNAALLYGMHYDNYTTYHMINLAVQPSETPLTDALKSKNYWDDNFDVALGHAIGGESNHSYPRYWHGYLVFLRPLLVFFNIVQIRLICQAAFFIVLAITVARLSLEEGAVGAMVGVLLSASFVTLGAAQAAETLPVFPSFLLSILGCLCVLRFSRSGSRSGKNKVLSRGFALFCLFGVLGALTVYVDFLDNPILTLCVPLAIFLFCERGVLSPRKALGILVLASLGWCMGYGLLWLGKWILASIVTGQPVLENAFSQAALRSGLSEDGAESGIALKAIRENVRYLGFMKYAYAATGIAAVACAAMLVVECRRRSGGAPRQLSSLACAVVSLLLVSVIPYVWYMALSNHSIVHAGLMAYRTQIGALFPWLLVVGLSIRHWVCRRNNVKSGELEAQAVWEVR